LRGSSENPWVRYSLKKNGGKNKEEGGKVCGEPLGGVQIFLRSVENPWGVLGL